MRTYVESKTRKSDEEARSALDALPRSHHPGRVAVPFPVASSSDYKARISNRELNNAIDIAPIQAVPVASLTAIQHSVDPKVVRQYLANGGAKPTGETHTDHGGIVDLPIVVKFGGKTYLHDGTHRATASKLRGVLSIKARVVDLDNSTQP